MNKAWRAYFWLTAFFGATTLVFGHFWAGAFQLVGVLGLYGFVWRVRIVNAVFWQIYLLFMLLGFGYGMLAFLDPQARAQVLARPVLLAVAIVLILLINGPLYFALIRYSSTRHAIWLGNPTKQSSA